MSQTVTPEVRQTGSHTSECLRRHAAGALAFSGSLTRVRVLTRLSNDSSFRTLSLTILNLLAQSTPRLYLS